MKKFSFLLLILLPTLSFFTYAEVKSYQEMRNQTITTIERNLKDTTQIPKPLTENELNQLRTAEQLRQQQLNAFQPYQQQRRGFDLPTRSRTPQQTGPSNPWAAPKQNPWVPARPSQTAAEKQKFSTRDSDELIQTPNIFIPKGAGKPEVPARNIYE